MNKQLTLSAVDSFGEPPDLLSFIRDVYAGEWGEGGGFLPLPFWQDSVALAVQAVPAHCSILLGMS